MPQSWLLPGVRADCLLAELKAEVSRDIGAMPFLWLKVNDAPSPGSERGSIDRNAIALLSEWLVWSVFKFDVLLSRRSLAAFTPQKL